MEALIVLFTSDRMYFRLIPQNNLIINNLVSASNKTVGSPSEFNLLMMFRKRLAFILRTNWKTQMGNRQIYRKLNKMAPILTTTL
jgi:hypothetical protein